MMIAEHKHLAEQGAELVELRLDYIRRSVNVARLLEGRQCAIVATVRRPKEGGKWMRSEEDRQMLLRTAIADGVDYVDLEHDIADKIPRYGRTKRIISYHNFNETPKNLAKIHKSLTKLDPDIVKIATMANNPIDNIRTLRLCRDSKVPTVAFCMGEMGLISRVLCGRFGSPMTYATFHEDRQLAPGQLSFRQMQDEYRYDQITEKTMILGVVADPVSHSLSPRVHNACLRQLDIDMLFLPFRVPKEYLNEFIEICPELGVRGLSVTIPHKEAILKCIQVLDDNAAGIRAANTVVFREQNAFGYNTDCDAAIASMADCLRRRAWQVSSGETAESDAETDNTVGTSDNLGGENPMADVSVCILGAGGVARAIAFGVRRAGGRVTICARDYRKSERLATELECASIDWPTRQNHGCDILVNCTPVGMYPEMDETPFEPDWFDKNTIVFDTIYNPEQTLFIKTARNNGCQTITGIDMFVRQAAAQFKLFTGREPDMELIRYETKRATSAARY
jgi:3-dehydroquinate dehydratase/shikimate dehydrogenase